jgi:hypothetical protein
VATASILVPHYMPLKEFALFTLGISTLVIGFIWGLRQLEKWRCPRGTIIHPAETIDSEPAASAEGVLTPLDAMRLQRQLEKWAHRDQIQTWVLDVMLKEPVLKSPEMQPDQTLTPCQLLGVAHWAALRRQSMSFLLTSSGPAFG